MNNTVRTIIVIFIILVMTLCLFFIPCKQFAYSLDGDAVFTGVRNIFSVFELYQLEKVSVSKVFYYIDWQLLFVELLPLTVLAIGSSLVFKD